MVAALEWRLGTPASACSGACARLPCSSPSGEVQATCSTRRWPGREMNRAAPTSFSCRSSPPPSAVSSATSCSGPLPSPDTSSRGWAMPSGNRQERSSGSTATGCGRCRRFRLREVSRDPRPCSSCRSWRSCWPPPCPPQITLAASGAPKVLVIAAASALVEAASPHGWDNATMQIVPTALAWVWPT